MGMEPPGRPANRDNQRHNSRGQEGTKPLQEGPAEALSEATASKQAVQSRTQNKAPKGVKKSKKESNTMILLDTELGAEETRRALRPLLLSSHPRGGGERACPPPGHTGRCGNRAAQGEDFVT